ncbi:MAG: ATP-grasp domain-containing protein [Ruminococcus flavefaciens]|nr:ATP-grasp domain-containing protein [Ruminococcus flavefaciens]MCM1231072.1 ATP-grasp domain-containing protein [Ruminococcus flavefaciens]
MNIWFNHWFSTAYHIINYMREACGNVRIIGTNSNPDCVYKLVCDEWYSEPSDGGFYVEHCLDFCKEHKIYVFVPHHNMREICKNSARFAEIGTKILGNTDKYDIDIINDKVKTYDYLNSCGLSEVIPEYYSCKSVAEFESAVGNLQEKGYKACFKMSVDEGGISYHVIEENPGISIRSGSASHISYEKALQIVKTYSFSVSLLVMPYLSQPEISVDCLKTDSGLLMIPRYKLGGRVSEIRFDRQIMDITQSISEKFALEMPYNAQYRFYDGKPYLLEINPRMSGGIQLSCTGSGINLPAMALKKLLGQPCEWRYPELSRKVAHIETPVIIE